MKKATVKILALLMALVLVFSIVPQTYAAPSSSKITTPATGYTSAGDVNYQTGTVSGKKIIKNWGARGEVCVFLSSKATAFYTGSNTFDQLSQLEGSHKQNSVSSSELYGALQDLMSSKHSFYTYYDGSKNVRDYYKYTDCVSNDTSKVALLYRGGLVSSTWDQGSTWNQEHCWPQSMIKKESYSDYSKPLGDIMHLRPSNPSENSGRGNTPYGTGSSYYNPGVSVRGDIARTVLYMYVRYGFTKVWGSSGVMQSMDVLLDWMEEDPVDTWEMGRNDSVQSITGTRNVFVDYPELAFILFDREVPADMTTPSGEAGNMGSTTPTCQHKNQETRNEKSATCTADGYTGDVYCKDCGVQISKGKAISAEGHKDENGDKKCDTCSANLGTCRHEREELRGKEAATCTADGYTGDTHCTQCGTRLSKGSVIPATGHKDTNADSKCDVCSATLSCTHTATEIKNTKEATCAEEGYTGDTVCTACGVTVQTGEAIAKAEHSPIVEDAIEATCCNDGFTGNTVCSVCGIAISGGEQIHATGEHTFGEWVTVQEPTADSKGKAQRTCSVGGYVEEKELAMEDMSTAPTEDKPAEQPPKDNSLVVIIGCGAVLLAGAIAVVFIVLKKKKQ